MIPKSATRKTKFRKWKNWFFLANFVLTIGLSSATTTKEMKDCQRFHVGNFKFDGPKEEIYIVRTLTESRMYRKFPEFYLRESIEWVSPCVARVKLIDIIDNRYSEEEKSRELNSGKEDGLLIITKTYKDGYYFKITKRGINLKFGGRAFITSPR